MTSYPNHLQDSGAAYFVVLIDYGRSREATVNPETTWRGAIDLVTEAWGDGLTVSFVHHILSDGTWDDRSEEAFGAAMTAVADAADPISMNMYCAIEQHVSTQAANCFNREDA
jgi:hypothetical protein